MGSLIESHFNQIRQIDLSCFLKTLEHAHSLNLTKINQYAKTRQFR